MKKNWNNWEIIEEIGHGTYGTIYKTKKTEKDKTIYSAIKHISLPKKQEEIKKHIENGNIKKSKDVLKYYKDLVDCIKKEI